MRLPEFMASNPAIAILDSTKLYTAQQCLRRYFFEHVLGWRPVKPNIHLHFGSAAHAALEHLLWLGHRDGGMRPEHKDPCMTVFLGEWREHVSPVDDELNAPKNPACFEWALAEYISAYYADNFEVLWTEVAGSVPLTPDGHCWIHFKLDAVIRDNDGLLKIMDHKTTGKPFPHDWTTDWRLSTQVGTYMHVGHCLFGDEFHGVIVNGISLARQPRVRADGKPYANQENNRPRFARANIEYSPEQSERWWFDTLHTYTGILAEHERLLDCSPNEMVMRAFPCNYASCWGCPYKRYCAAWPNPLQHCDEPPIEMIVQHWNPRDRERESRALVEPTGAGSFRITEKGEPEHETQNG